MQGGVLVFSRASGLQPSHVSAVSGMVPDREIEVMQANWVHRRIGRNEPVVDVLPGGDWAAVRVWWAPSGMLGAMVHPACEFVAPSGPALAAGLAVPQSACKPPRRAPCEGGTTGRPA